MNRQERKKLTLHLDTPGRYKENEVPMVEICLDSPLNTPIALTNVSQVTPSENVDGWIGPVEVIQFDPREVSKSDSEKMEPESIFTSQPSNIHQDEFNSPSDIVNFEFFDDRANVRFTRQRKESEEMKDKLLISPIAKLKDTISEENNRQDNSDEFSDCTSFYKKNTLNLNDGEKRIKAKELDETRNESSPFIKTNKNYSEESNANHGGLNGNIENEQIGSFTNAYDIYKSTIVKQYKPQKDYSRFISINSNPRRNSISNRESSSKSELKESFEETKKKELNVKRKMALILIEDCHKRLIVGRVIKELRVYAMRKKNAIKKICDLVMKWKQRKEKIKTLERYMNHCASLIQENYSKYQIKRSKSNPKISKPNRISIHKKSASNLRQQSNESENFLKHELRNRQNSKKVVDYMLNAKMSFTKAYNRFINNKDDANILKKVKGHSARKESEYKPLNMESSAQKLLSLYNSVEGKFSPKSARPVDCDDFQEDPDSLKNTLRKPKKDFLKRNSKKVAGRKVNWENVPRRIDCWNPNAKSIRSQKLSPKKTIERQSKKPTPDKEQSMNLIEEVQNMQITDKLTMHKLQRLYLKYHGDHQSNIK